jgi:hypothetical protein
MTPVIVQGSVPDDRWRAVLDSVFARPAYRWETPLDPFAPFRKAWFWLVHLLQTLRTASPSLYWIVIGAVVALLATILFHAFFVTYRTVRADVHEDVQSNAAPVEVRDAAWYGREAERLASEGRYAEAMEADFLRLILQLDARRIVRFHPSRTPNEYVRDAGLSADARRELGELVRRLYRFAFARVPCGLSDLRDWRALAAVERYARV